MTNISLPFIWLITLIVGLPQLSETVYTPSLPDIAYSLHASEEMVEFTLTIYLLSFAIGTLFWGKLSDKLGRKPCILAGMVIYIIGSAGCYLSDSIQILMVARFIQAFGGSIGSVLGQAICRDAFHGPKLGQAYSIIGSSLAIFPAIGPLVGGLIAENFGWQNIFLFLVIFAIVLGLLIAKYLPETHNITNRIPISILDVALKLVKDKNVIGFGLIVAACNGITFSYFAEGSFYLIEILGFSPSSYGFSFILIAVSTMCGGIFSKKLLTSHPAQTVMKYGIFIVITSNGIFSSFIILNSHVWPAPIFLVITISILCQMCNMFGVCMATSNALALALVDFKWCIGAASSLFGFFYYTLISLFTFGMGYLHNGTLIPMPLYFLSISMFMVIVRKTLLTKLYQVP
ncbi:MAG: multidrug effflux MFS transporter [Alphaproteobacteria bacterium]